MHTNKFFISISINLSKIQEFLNYIVVKKIFIPKIRVYSEIENLKNVYKQ